MEACTVKQGFDRSRAGQGVKWDFTLASPSAQLDSCCMLAVHCLKMTIHTGLADSLLSLTKVLK